MYVIQIKMDPYGVIWMHYRLEIVRNSYLKM
jgi:hypothetical protein